MTLRRTKRNAANTDMKKRTVMERLPCWARLRCRPPDVPGWGIVDRRRAVWPVPPQRRSAGQRAKRLDLLALLCAALTSATAAAASPPPAFEVHEWGLLEVRGDRARLFAGPPAQLGALRVPLRKP